MSLDRPLEINRKLLRKHVVGVLGFTSIFSVMILNGLHSSLGNRTNLWDLLKKVIKLY